MLFYYRVVTKKNHRRRYSAAHRLPETFSILPGRSSPQPTDGLIGILLPATAVATVGATQFPRRFLSADRQGSRDVEIRQGSVEWLHYVFSPFENGPRRKKCRVQWRVQRR